MAGAPEITGEIVEPWLPDVLARQPGVYRSRLGSLGLTISEITLKGDVAGMLSAARPPSHASPSQSSASVSLAGAFAGARTARSRN